MKEALAMAVADWRNHRKSVFVVLLLMGIGLIWWNQQTLRIWAYFVHPFATPQVFFDAGKAATLSAERRTELERELFNEVYLWNDQSRRYNGPQGLAQREARWRTMAAEGYELAYLTLKVFEPSTVQVHNPLPVLKRLDELARQGDAGAMCLLSAISYRLPSRPGIDWSEQRSLARYWMQKGAALGHPDCYIQLGGRLRAGSAGFQQDMARGTDLLIKALRSGYLRAAVSFWGPVEERGLDGVRHRQLVYCWGFQAAKYWFSDADLSLVVYRNKAPPERRASLEEELNQLRQWHPEIEECIELTNAVQEE